MNKETIVLYSAIKISDIHANHLTAAIQEIEALGLLPVKKNLLQNLSRENLYLLDFLVNRFAKLQDTIGEKIFPNFLILQEEDIGNKSFIDRLNLLEKLRIIPSVNFWQKMRRTRNELTHEYPEFFTFQEKTLNDCFEKTKELIRFWEELKSNITKKLPGVFLEK